MKNVKLALPVLYSELIKFVCDLAQRELGISAASEKIDEAQILERIKDLKNYYVLVIMMAGMVDDFRDTINQMLRAMNLPLSIMVIKIGKNQEEND